MSVKIKGSMKSVIFIILIVFTTAGLVLLIILGPTEVQQSTPGSVTQNPDGTQLIKVSVKGGYSPKSFTVKANEPTILRMESLGTYGCERAFTIPKLQINRMLPVSGITDISIPPQFAGTVLVGTCSMGMYSFLINYN